MDKVHDECLDLAKEQHTEPIDLGGTILKVGMDAAMGIKNETRVNQMNKNEIERMMKLKNETLKKLM